MRVLSDLINVDLTLGVCCDVPNLYPLLPLHLPCQVLCCVNCSNYCKSPPSSSLTIFLHQLCRPHPFTHPVKMEKDFGTITELKEEVEEPTGEVIQSLSSSSYFNSSFLNFQCFNSFSFSLWIMSDYWTRCQQLSTVEKGPNTHWKHPTTRKTDKARQSG
jgi:hypothetical protein